MKVRQEQIEGTPFDTQILVERVKPGDRVLIGGEWRLVADTIRYSGGVILRFDHGDFTSEAVYDLGTTVDVRV